MTYTCVKVLLLEPKEGRKDHQREEEHFGVLGTAFEERERERQKKMWADDKELLILCLCCELSKSRKEEEEEEAIRCRTSSK